MLNGKRYLKNSNGSKLSIKSTLDTEIFLKIGIKISAQC